MQVLAAGLLGCLLGVPIAQAADPTRPIVGQDVMGDTSRTGPDGWAQAPVSRTQAPTGQTRIAPDTRPGPAEAKTLPAGEDPGTPAPTHPSGPGTLDVPSAPVKPGG